MLHEAEEWILTFEYEKIEMESQTSQPTDDVN